MRRRWWVLLVLLVVGIIGANLPHYADNDYDHDGYVDICSDGYPAGPENPC